MRSRRALLRAPGNFEIITEDIVPSADELLVRVEVCGLCNWELNHYAGVVGDCPQFLGHEWAGYIVEIGQNVKGFSIGDKVTVMPVYVGFSEYALVDYRKAVKLANHVDVSKALGEPLKCVMTVNQATEAKAGDIGVVYGCGPMGLWNIQIFRGNFLSKLIAIDIDDEKLALAARYGATHTINPRREDVLEKVSDITRGHFADFVIEGTGIPEELINCVKLLRQSGRGRIILMSSHKKPAASFDFREMISRSAVLVVAHAKYSSDQLLDLKRGIAFFESGIIQMDDIITHCYSLDEIGKAFEDLKNKPKGYIKGVVYPNKTKGGNIA